MKPTLCENLDPNNLLKKDSFPLQLKIQARGVFKLGIRE